MVDISFAAGTRVEKGTQLLQQDISSEQAQLPGAEAEHTLAWSNLQRASQLFDERIISRAEKRLQPPKSHDTLRFRPMSVNGVGRPLCAEASLEGLFAHNCWQTLYR